jgi:hypothetical protein
MCFHPVEISIPPSYFGCIVSYILKFSLVLNYFTMFLHINEFFIDLILYVDVVSNYVTCSTNNGRVFRHVVLVVQYFYIICKIDGVVYGDPVKLFFSGDVHQLIFLCKSLFNCLHFVKSICVFVHFETHIPLCYPKFIIYLTLLNSQLCKFILHRNNNSIKFFFK